MVPLPALTSALHAAWRALPRNARRQALYRLIELVAPRRSPPAALGPGPVVVGGALSTASGLGESARLCLDALRALGWDAEHADVSRFFLRPDLPHDLPGRPARANAGGTLILHVDGPHTPYVALRLGRAFLRRRRVIGYWAWELATMGAEWRQGLSRVHEIWAPSRFNADALRAWVDVPVKIVPHPVRAAVEAPARERFGLRPNVFTVLTAFDMGSTYSRKNPRAAVAAFRRAFGDDPSCLLLLKVGHSGDAPWAMADLTDAIAGMSNVRLLRETLSRADMGLLVASVDAVLSLHRAEGFGLLLAEAMLRGVAVVATGWSGNLDFMTPDDSGLVGYRLIPARDPQGAYDMPSALWADPDVEEAASWLRRLRDDPGFRADLAKRGRAAASTKLSLAAFHRAVADSLPPPEGNASGAVDRSANPIPNDNQNETAP